MCSCLKLQAAAVSALPEWRGRLQVRAPVTGTAMLCIHWACCETEAVWAFWGGRWHHPASDSWFTWLVLQCCKV